MTYRSTKLYDHNLGLSAVFRQHKATSHCNKLHGYALAFRIEFEAQELDARGWVVDFGGLKPVKAQLESLFDHVLLVAHDDPALPIFQHLEEHGLVDLYVVPGVGCESFAKQVFDIVDQWLGKMAYKPRVRVASVECREHGANSAIYSE